MPPLFAHPLSVRALGSTAATAAAGSATNILEFYVDFVCPFSKKIFTRLVEDVVPYAEEAYPGKVAFVLRQQVQPWHPQSALLHEVLIAATRVSPSAFQATAKTLFAVSENFYDAYSYSKSRIQLYEELAAEVEKGAGVDKSKILALLKLNTADGAKNGGNSVTDELKVQIRIARQNAIHVSPTVLWNGLIDNNVSSGWDLAKWKEFLDERVH
ncbi:hypothetical protein DFJ73DRAFT_868124 [Zopfochytrium polystomum]|nr:hypothetical protein DFJ73DRAFT_868124 [Zopfochytrium polystomum]